MFNYGKELSVYCSRYKCIKVSAILDPLLLISYIYIYVINPPPTIYAIILFMQVINKGAMRCLQAI